MKKTIRVLGLNTGHNATLAYLEDGVLKEAIAEERFTHIKNNGGIPINCLNYLYKKYSLEPKSFDSIAVNGDHCGAVIGLPIPGKVNRKFTLTARLIQFGKNVLHLNNSKFFLYWFYRLNMILRIFSTRKENKYLKDVFGLKVNKDIFRYNHHLCHAASAYYSSPYSKKKALVLTLDAEGDNLCSTVSIFDGLKYKKVAQTPFGHSLAELYMYVTKYMAMTPGEHEYKVMGMAPYAKSYGIGRLYDRIKKYIVLKKKNNLVFKSKFPTFTAYPVLLNELREYRFDDISGAFQKLIEERICEWVTNCVKKTGISTVCCAGGVFMNVKLNMRVRQLGCVKKLFVQPSCGDDSGSIGSAYLAHRDLVMAAGEKKHGISPFTSIYLGSSVTNDEVGEFFKKNKALQKKYKIRKVKDVELETAKLLKQKKVVARFNGRMEFGARALGNRSILAHPTDYDTVKVINEQMKNRDFWMPFAGSILDEDKKKYLLEADSFFSPYMMMTYQGTDKAVREMRAAMHPYDFTMRPQMVTKALNPRYHKLISYFKKLTGISGVLNTSFNLHGYPIVAYPAEAIHAFENSGLEYLTIEDYLISKKG